MSLTLDNTFGALFVGNIVAAVLLGVSFLQTLYYFTHQKDNWFLKSMVIAVIALDTLHHAFISHALYTYMITDWGRSLQSDGVIWSVVAPVLCSGFVAVIVQSFLTFRIWRLSYQNKYLTGTAGILIMGGFVVILLYTGEAFRLMSFSDLLKLKPEILSARAITAAITDLFIAITLCTLLHRSRTGFERSDAMVTKLIIFTVNTGLITSLCALGSLISLLVTANTSVYSAWYFCLCRLYTTSLLATLNAREIIRGSFAPDGTVSFFLPKFDESTEDSPHTISIKIDTIHGEGPGEKEKVPDNSPESTEEESTPSQQGFSI